MGPSSIRAKTTVLAIAVSALAVIIGSYVLITVLRGSLLDQLDSELLERSVDVSESVEAFGIDETVFPGDFGTLTAIFDNNDELVDIDIGGVTGADIINGLPPEHFESVDLVDGGSDFSGYTVALPAVGFEKSRTVGFTATGDAEDYWVYMARSLAPLEATVRTVRNWALIAGPLFVGLIGLLAWWLIGRALRSVDIMRAEVDEITTTADLSRRVHEPNADDEVSRLASTMNRMLGRLQANEHRQQRFMSDAAHELRSPLASINAQLDVDLAHPATADWPATAVAVRQDSERLQRIIESLLGMARAEATEGPGSRLVDLDDIIFGQAASVVRPDGVTVDVSGVRASTVRGSADQLERVVVNLLSNAVRHARSSVVVSTHVESDSASDGDSTSDGSSVGEVVLTVDDDGAGVPESDREVIFDRFVRLDESRSRDKGGTGLGLALTREVVTNHGGSVTVGTSPSGGARFEVRLPNA